MPESWDSMRPRIKRREREFIETHGPCQKCGSTQSLEVFWRDRAAKRTRDMQNFWVKSDEVRKQWESDLWVLCHTCMTRHKYGLEHGGGVTGIKGCKCGPCTDKRRGYVAGRMRMYRKKKREGKTSVDLRKGPEKEAGLDQGPRPLR